MTDLLARTRLIPFCFGVTGHRDLVEADLEGLGSAVVSLLGEHRKRMPSTPFLLLSGLAAGADQLVAGKALKSDLKIDLVAVLPMPEAVYRTTMNATEAVEFDRLLGLASVTIVLPFQPGVTIESVMESEEQRALQYEALAVFLATHAQVLIALWDGEKSEAKGGTSRVVEHMLSNRLGFVWHIVTPRGHAAGSRGGVTPRGHAAGSRRGVTRRGHAAGSRRGVTRRGHAAGPA